MENKYLDNIINRYDNEGILPYLSVKDFPNLSTESISFKADNETINGYLYFYPHYKKNKLVIFAHGLGGGIISYTREIETVCQEGYMVLGFDMVGCFSSTGKSIKSMNEFAFDLDACIQYVQSNKELKDKEIILVGHSCGGYAVGCNVIKHKEIKKAVMISPFDTPIDFVKSVFGEDNKEAQEEYSVNERQVHPELSDIYLSETLNNVKTDCLIIGSLDDNIVLTEHGFSKIRSSVNNPFIHFLEVERKGHLPQFGYTAIDLLNKLQAELQTIDLSNKDKLNELHTRYNLFDLTEQDMNVWKQIFAFMEK